MLFKPIGLGEVGDRARGSSINPLGLLLGTIENKLVEGVIRDHVVVKSQGECILKSSGNFRKRLQS